MMNARKIRIHYPWQKTPIRGGFFVPTLKLDEIKEDGLRAAVFFKLRGKAEFVVKDGRLGVWFTRVR
jgi:hypothetical protein